MFASNTSLPIATFSVPVVFSFNVWEPTATLLAPVLSSNALYPTATLLDVVVFAVNAL